MYQFFETIKIVDGKVLNLHYHQERMDKTLRMNYSGFFIPGLQTIISVPLEFLKGIIKCKIEYSSYSYCVSFEIYKPREINSLKLLTDDSIKYDFKYTDRSDLLRLLDHRGKCDEILIVKNNMVADTSFSNIIFNDGNRWYTPVNPLLRGTVRARLLKEGKIIERKIFAEDIPKYNYFKLINSMLDDDLNDKKPASAIAF